MLIDSRFDYRSIDLMKNRLQTSKPTSSGLIVIDSRNQPRHRFQISNQKAAAIGGQPADVLKYRLIDYQY
jgi:hypothetical protein